MTRNVVGVERLLRDHGLSRFAEGAVGRDLLRESVPARRRPKGQ
ncbi:MAG: hypothetical protein U1E25_01030 [Methylocystis sp.]